MVSPLITKILQSKEFWVAFASIVVVLIEKVGTKKLKRISPQSSFLDGITIEEDPSRNKTLLKNNLNKQQAISFLILVMKDPEVKKALGNILQQILDGFKKSGNKEFVDFGNAVMTGAYS
jgi:hypothetical protein